VPLGDQHALHFAQHLVRIGIEFQGVRHHHEVDAVVGKGQVVQVRTHFGDTVVAAVVAAEAEGHAIGAQKIMAGQRKLHGVEAENVGNQFVVLHLFPVEHILSGRRRQPVLESLN